MPVDSSSLVDIHNHLVPGVDDGARDLRAVLDSVGRLARAGIRRIVTTPHLPGSLTLDPDRLADRLDVVTAAWRSAAAAIRERFPDVEFRRGHEVALDVPDVDLSDPRVRLAGTSFVLVEWPRLQLPPGTVRVLTRIVEQGYRPIVAHPERYVGMAYHPDLPARWREAGAYLQVNYGSLVGRYGAEARELALQLLRMGWVDYLASDFHGHARLGIYKDEAWAELDPLGAEELLVYLCRMNPGRVLEDEEPLPVPVLPERRGIWARLKGMLRSPTA
ncbi:MAG TPA: CpsB/CapC family capsule biosynthesis tyrosine phosphatase [Longimicrobiales bacterium]|nr:CpsB/CapC family capsule biosynthesis tyrosine phosphatase [Longimicrobiales bacterium]